MANTQQPPLGGAHQIAHTLAQMGALGVNKSHKGHRRRLLGSHN